MQGGCSPPCKLASTSSPHAASCGQWIGQWVAPSQWVATTMQIPSAKGQQAHWRISLVTSEPSFSCVAHPVQVLALQDCAHRNVYTSEWVATAEVSEFIRVSQPPGNLPGLLDKHRGAPWVSLGSLWWSVQKCCPDFRAQGDKFSMERMIYHWPGPLCHDKVSHK